MLILAVSAAVALQSDEPWMEEPGFELRPPIERTSRRVSVWHVSLSWSALTWVVGSTEGVGPGSGWSVDAPEFALGTITWAYGLLMGVAGSVSGGGEGTEEIAEPSGAGWDWFGSIPAGVWTEGREVWGIGSYEETRHRDEEKGGGIVYVRALVGAEAGWRWRRAKISGLIGWSWHNMNFDNRGDQTGSGPFVGLHLDWIFSRNLSIGVRGDLHYWTDFVGDSNWTGSVSVPLVLRW